MFLHYMLYRSIWQSFTFHLKCENFLHPVLLWFSSTFSNHHNLLLMTIYPIHSMPIKSVPQVCMFMSLSCNLTSHIAHMFTLYVIQIVTHASKQLPFTFRPIILVYKNYLNYLSLFHALLTLNNKA